MACVDWRGDAKDAILNAMQRCGRHVADRLAAVQHCNGRFLRLLAHKTDG